MGDEYHIHVEDFHHSAHEESVGGGGFLLLEQEDPHSRCHETGKAGGHAAGDAGVTAHTPVSAGDKTLDPSHQSGDDTGDRIKEKSCGERSHVTDIQHHLVIIDTEMRGKDRSDPVEQTDNDLRNDPEFPTLGHLPYENRHQHIQRSDSRHFHDHVKHVNPLSPTNRSKAQIY